MGYSVRQMYVDLGQRREKKVKFLRRQSTDSHRLKGVQKNKPRKHEKFTESLHYVYYCVFFDFFVCEGPKYRETLIVWAARLNQHIYLKGILISKCGSKHMLHWKRDSSFVSTEDENLWIVSRLILFDGSRAPKRSP